MFDMFLILYYKFLFEIAIYDFKQNLSFNTFWYKIFELSAFRHKNYTCNINCELLYIPYYNGLSNSSLICISQINNKISISLHILYYIVLQDKDGHCAEDSSTTQQYSNSQGISVWL